MGNRPFLHYLHTPEAEIQQPRGSFLCFRSSLDSQRPLLFLHGFTTFLELARETVSARGKPISPETTVPGPAVVRVQGSELEHWQWSPMQAGWRPRSLPGGTPRTALSFPGSFPRVPGNLRPPLRHQWACYTQHSQLWPWSHHCQPGRTDLWVFLPLSVDHGSLSSFAPQLCDSSPWITGHVVGGPSNIHWMAWHGGTGL